MDNMTKDSLMSGLDSVVAYSKAAATSASDATARVAENSELAPAFNSLSQAFEQQLSAFVQLTSILKGFVAAS